MFERCLMHLLLTRFRLQKPASCLGSILKPRLMDTGMSVFGVLCLIRSSSDLTESHFWHLAFAMAWRCVSLFTTTFQTHCRSMRLILRQTHGESCFCIAILFVVCLSIVWLQQSVSAKHQHRPHHSAILPCAAVSRCG
jgi:membrane protein CcdC involved in cytochrome C biogenesis